MSQRTAMLVATALTVFVVIALVGVMWQLFQKSTVDTLGLQVAPAAPTTELAGETHAVTGPTEAEVAQREAAYQQLIDQANQRLDDAYKQQQELTQELAAEKSKQATAVLAPAPAPAPDDVQPKYNLSADQAAALALQAEKGAVLVKPAELVSFHDATAFEVTLDRGVVYIDANSGKVLYDSAVVIVVHDGGGGGNSGGGNPQASAPKVTTKGKENEHEGDHESHDQHTSQPSGQQQNKTQSGHDD